MSLLEVIEKLQDKQDLNDQEREFVVSHLCQFEAFQQEKIEQDNRRTYLLDKHFKGI